MRKRSFHQTGPLAGLDVRPLARPLSQEEVERRFRERKWPPILLIVISLVLWALIGWAAHAIYQALI